MKVLLDLQTLQSDSRGRGIGSYSRGLADALLRRDDFDWHVLLSESMPLTFAEARRWASDRVPRSRIHVFRGLTGVRGVESGLNGRVQAAETLYAGFIAALGVDLVHVASPFDGWGDDTTVGWTSSFGPPARSATVYDLIPFEEPDKFLPTRAIRDWYQRRLAGLKQADGFLAISDFTRQRVIDRLAVDPSEITAIGADANPVFRKTKLSDYAERQLRDKYRVNKPFVIHVGALEPRKNVELLVQAMAMLDPGVQTRHQLLLVAHAARLEKDHLRQLASKAGLPPNSIVCPDLVPDDDLAQLYSAARVAVMPSLSEGFGLPLLEAMRCGCPVLGSNRTSIPEVVGNPELTFDPAQASALAERLSKMLTNEQFWVAAREHSERQQAQFSWERSARLACDAFHETIERRRSAAGPHPNRPRLVISSGGVRNGAGANSKTAGQSAPAARTGSSITPDGPDPTVLEVDHGALTPAQRRSIELRPAMLLHMQNHNGGEPVSGMDAYWAAGYARQGFDLGTAGRHHPNVLGTVEPSRGSGNEWALTLNGISRTASSGTPRSYTFTSQAEALAFVSSHHPLASARAVTGEIKRLGRTYNLGANIREIATALADNHAPQREPRLLVDVTELAKLDAKSGIQRVVRNMLVALVGGEHAYRIEPIYRAGDAYRFGRAFGQKFFGVSFPGLADHIVDFRDNDTFLGLDLDAGITAGAAALLAKQHLRGMKIVNVVYDVLPIRRPDWFVPELNQAFRRWMRSVSTFADGMACISETTADDVRQLLGERERARNAAIMVGAFHLGAELEPAASAASDSAELAGWRPGSAPKYTFLSVGTVEPRKGYAQLLDAAEALWAAGQDIGFVIIGKPGWNVAALIERLEFHQQRGAKLRWFRAASDEMLRQAYRTSTAAILPSEGEGFGLPLIEAAHFGLPVLARNLAVFREIGGSGVAYFDSESGAELADAILAWIREYEQGRAPKPDGVKRLTWTESAEQLLAFVDCVPHSP